MTIPKFTDINGRMATHQHPLRETAYDVEDVHTGARTKLVDFIIHRIFYPVLMADRSGPHGETIERMRVAAQCAINRLRAYRSVQEVIDGFRQDLGSKSVLATQSELRMLHLPVISDLRDDFDRKARELGFEPDTLLTSLCSTPKGHTTMDQERVSDRAYALWEKAGQPDGAHDQHWQQACHDIEAEDGTTTAHTTPVAEMIPDTVIHHLDEAEDQGVSPQSATTKQS